MLFEDRLDAACQLARALWAWRERDPLVLAIAPRAVPLGRVIADRLDAELDVVLVRALGSPQNPAYAIGAVHESGELTLAADIGFAGVSREALERERSAQLARLREVRDHFVRRAPLAIAARSVIVVDEALGNGLTMAAALRHVAAAGARERVCAVPVAAREGLARVAPLADACVVAAVVERVRAAGDFYRRLGPVDEEEVAELLAA